ncbi:MAG: hypothetical protein WC578_00555 [Candidatus Omnitrophota bacterium]|jgi:7-cyano-7-deazaguanine synthase in queuosine biosynthesis
MKNTEEIAVLYSGGTDSTCAAALVAEKFQKVHLLTYKRFGISSAEHSVLNAQKLKEKFGQEKFIHSILDVDRLCKNISYSRYLYYAKKYGFFLLTCGPCKLTLHLRSLIYCLDQDIGYACDGANKNMLGIFPDQMEEVIDELRNLYLSYGVKYVTPVFDFDYPNNIEWADKLGFKELFGEDISGAETPGVTTGKALYQMNILPSENIKGTKFDRKMQIRCFQFTLFHIFANGYYIPIYGLDKYRKAFMDFYKEKILDYRIMIDEYLNKGDKSRLHYLLH